jgi:hypothetical protein
VSGDLVSVGPEDHSDGAHRRRDRRRSHTHQFVAALRLVINEWSWSTITTSPGAIPRLTDLRDKIRVFVLPERRSDRVQPRAVKLKMSNSARKRPSKPSSRRRAT